jgi:CDP-diacylglycerol--serine O-phosphatidyltransferase
MPNEPIKKRRSRRKRWRKESEVRRRTYIWPNLFTTANLFSGFFGIVNSINGNFELAAIAVFASCVFDILDGKVARLTGGTSRFGVEYDSLADLVAFGVGPGLLMYLMALKPYGRIGWLAAFVFMACGALRLARFNVQVETASKKYFVGLPIPGGASMIAASVLFISHWNVTVTGSLISPALLVMTVVLGFCMISTMPYNSFKDVEFIMARPSSVMFGVVVLVTVVAVTPAFMLFSILALYTVSGPVRWTAWKIKGKKGFQEGIPAQQTSSALTPEIIAAERKPVPEVKIPGENTQD